MPKKKGLIEMSAGRLAQSVKDGYRANARYCFILGSGASYTAGIPTGQVLMDEWRDFLLEKEREDSGYIAECAQECGMTVDQWKPLFEAGYELLSKDYFDLYDLRFTGDPIVGYNYLLEVMEQASPSIGHFMLAALLEHTQNKLVITTNFDTLVEDALYLYHDKRPAVAGHERLASFVNNTELKDRPVIAKIHRDLMLRPKNRGDELAELDKNWRESLTVALSQYTPIVIGYGGGDQTLMNLLKDIRPRTIYWCAVNKDEVFNNPDVVEILNHAEQGYLVEIAGFDHIMCMLYQSMVASEENNPVTRLNAFKDGVMAKYQETEKTVRTAKKRPQTKPAPAPVPSPELEKSAPAVPTEPEKPANSSPPAPTKPKGVLSKEKLTPYGSSTRIITLRNTLSGVPDDADDFSEAQDRSVLGWQSGDELIVAGEGGVAAPQSCKGLFHVWSSLEQINGAKFLDTSCVTDMNGMFYWCEKLNALDVSRWDVSNVQDMGYMFGICISLTELMVGEWNVSKVRNMRRMFVQCRSLTKLDVSRWNVSDKTNTEEMFLFTPWQSNPPIK